MYGHLRWLLWTKWCSLPEGRYALRAVATPLSEVFHDLQNLFRPSSPKFCSLPHSICLCALFCTASYLHLNVCPSINVSILTTGIECALTIQIMCKLSHARFNCDVNIMVSTVGQNWCCWPACCGRGRGSRGAFVYCVCHTV